MQFENRIKCHPEYLQYIQESDVLRQGCISICDNKQVEQMIYLLPGNDNGIFEVRIFKAHPTDTYIPNECDFKLKYYISNDEFDSFYFDDIIWARHFIRVLDTTHPEYKNRPLPKN